MPRAVDFCANMIVDCLDAFSQDANMLSHIFLALKTTYHAPGFDDPYAMPSAPLWTRLQEPFELFETLVRGLRQPTTRFYTTTAMESMLHAHRPCDEALVVGWLRESPRALGALIDATARLGAATTMLQRQEDWIRARVVITLRNFIAAPADVLGLAINQGMLDAIAPRPGEYSTTSVIGILDDLCERLDSIRGSLRPRLGAAAGTALGDLRGYGVQERGLRERWNKLVRALDLDGAALRLCGGCGVTGRDATVWRCGGCRTRWYCSRACQRLDRAAHRKRCGGSLT